MVKQKPQAEHKPPKKKKKAKRLEIEAAAIARGTELGKIQAHKKKPLEQSLKEHLGKLIDNMKIDPVTLLATLGLTIVVKNTIDASEDLRGKLDASKSGKELSKYFAEPFATAAKLAGYLGETAAGTYQEPKEKYEGLFPDWADWLISFSLAYLIVNHGGQLFGLLGTGLGSILGRLLG